MTLSPSTRPVTPCNSTRGSSSIGDSRVLRPAGGGGGMDGRDLSQAVGEGATRPWVEEELLEQRQLLLGLEPGEGAPHVGHRHGAEPVRDGRAQAAVDVVVTS